MSAAEKTTIRPDVEKYSRTKSASGSASSHSGDPVAIGLNGATLDEVYEIAEGLKIDVTELKKKYANLNPGQQRMNLGNRIRKVVNTMNATKEGSGDELFSKLATRVQKAVQSRAAEAAKVRAAAEKVTPKVTNINAAKSAPTKAPAKQPSKPVKGRK